MVNQSQSEAARSALDHERESLEAQLAEIGHGESGGLDYDSNFADTSQVTAERGEAEALAGELSDALREVEAALGRIDDGTYGRCMRCSEEIPESRLEAMPMARYCVTCASSS